jgi:hypothetical protein
VTLQNQSQISAFLAGKGLTAAQIAGVEGNLQIESSGDPAAYNPHERAIGIVQWEGPRRTALQAFARSMGTTETNLNAQLGFMWQELTTTESGALAALTASTTPAGAATAFDQKYERSAASSLPLRVAAAEKLAAGGIQGGSGVTAGGGGSGAAATPAGFDWNPLNWPADALGAIGRYIVDGFLVVTGVVLVVVALVLVAKAGDSSSSSSPSSPAPAPAKAHPRRAAAEGAGEDAAEVAA